MRIHTYQVFTNGVSHIHIHIRHVSCDLDYYSRLLLLLPILIIGGSQVGYLTVSVTWPPAFTLCLLLCILQSCQHHLSQSLGLLMSIPLVRTGQPSILLLLVVVRARQVDIYASIDI